MNPLGPRPWPVTMGATAAVVAAALATALSVLLGLTQQEIANASSAARQATLFSDVYTDSSAMDADLTQIMLLDDAPALAAQRAEAVAGYRSDSNAVDADLASLSGDRVSTRDTRQDLTAYRARATTAEAAPTRAAGLSAYDDATALAHRKLLPAARSAAGNRAAGMDNAVRHERVLSVFGTVVAILLGLTLLALAGLVLLISRRLWGRRIGRPLVVCVLVTLAVAGASVTIFHLGDARARAGRDDVTGFLALDRAAGGAYDVAADPARYLITGRDHEWSKDAADEEPQVQRSVAGVTRIEWYAYGNTLTGLFAGIDQGRIAAADVSLYNAGGSAADGFSAFRGSLLASELPVISAGGQRLSTARSLYLVWYVIPVATMLVVLFLAGQAVRRRSGTPSIR
ncbi:hypothetical protein [Actinoplanes sp. NPDC051411]|uniref:hypothetical protein n=1 Tax=Actinoplanes sp. NPDC051411 TaxID=3155522 RepID=UPI003440E31A